VNREQRRWAKKTGVELRDENDPASYVEIYEDRFYISVDLVRKDHPRGLDFADMMRSVLALIHDRAPDLGYGEPSPEWSPYAEFVRMELIEWDEEVRDTDQWLVDSGHEPGVRLFLDPHRVGWEWEDGVGPIPDPNFKLDKKFWGLLPSEKTQIFEILTEQGFLPEPVINIETALAPRRIDVFFRWALSPFRFRPDSRIAGLLNRIRPGLGGGGWSTRPHGAKGHWKNQWYPSLQAHKRIWIDDYETGGR